LLDFGLLVEELEPRDRKQIFKDIRSAPERGDSHFTADELAREESIRGVIDALSFLYLGADDVDMPFDEAVEFGIERAKQNTLFVYEDVSVRIDEETRRTTKPYSRR